MKAYFTLLLGASLILAQTAWVSALVTNNVPTKPSLPAELENFLAKAEIFTLFSLNPHPDVEQKSTNTFANHAILGQVNIVQATTRASLISALNDGIEDAGLGASGVPSPLPSCFNPRHGIRAKKVDETVEFLICFECAQIQVSSNKGKRWFLMTNKRPTEIFNQVLRKNGLRLPKN